MWIAKYTKCREDYDDEFVVVRFVDSLICFKNNLRFLEIFILLNTDSSGTIQMFLVKKFIEPSQKIRNIMPTGFKLS